MKLQNKLFAIISLLTLAVVTYQLITPISLTFGLKAMLAVAFAAISYALIYYVLIQPIKALNKNIHKVNFTHGSPQNLPVKQHDEIGAITRRINEVFKKMNLMDDNLRTITREHNQELQNLTLQLQKEVTQRTLAEKKINRDRKYLTQTARYDNLTTLPNSVFFNEILNKAINRAKRHNEIIAIIIISVDTYSELRKDLSFDKNNNFIKEVGRLLAKTLRSEDILAKLDEDEFVILLSDIKKSKFAATVAEKLLNASAQPLMFEGKSYQLSLSMGISVYPHDGETLEELLNHTDEALYKAKNKGGNQYEFYSKELNLEAHEHIKLESALRKAIENNELVVFYQPKFNIKRGKISGVETLLRWEHPELGVIPPNRFVALAEETGLIMSLGEWVLREACKTNKYWQDEGYEHITASVNLSAKQFHHPNITKVINKVLAETKLNPKYLEIEITEKIVMDDADIAYAILNNIKSTGVQISIDHFGTGYTAISYLKIFPITTIKLDQIFINGIPNNPNDVAITNAVIALTHSLGLEVVAEGVETAEQVQYLTNQNCDVLQGYFLSHPLPAKQVAQQLKKLREEVLI